MLNSSTIQRPPAGPGTPRGRLLFTLEVGGPGVEIADAVNIRIQAGRGLAPRRKVEVVIEADRSIPVVRENAKNRDEKRRESPRLS
jgi:hypothetical protein